MLHNVATMACAIARKGFARWRTRALVRSRTRLPDPTLHRSCRFDRSNCIRPKRIHQKGAAQHRTQRKGEGHVQCCDGARGDTPLTFRPRYFRLATRNALGQRAQLYCVSERVCAMPAARCELCDFIRLHDSRACLWVVLQIVTPILCGGHCRL